MWPVELKKGDSFAATGIFVERFTGAPEVRRGVSYVVVRGQGVGERWVADEARRSSELLEEDGRTVFAEAVVPPVRLVIVGAGDIGLYLADRIRVNDWDEVSFILIMILVVVTVMDLLSKAFRLRLIKATAPSIRRAGRWWPRPRSRVTGRIAAPAAGSRRSARSTRRRNPRRR